MEPLEDKIKQLQTGEGAPPARDTLLVVLRLSWPAILEQIMVTLVQYVDTAMVGSLGSGATAAVGLTATTTWLFGGLFGAAAVGFSVQVAQHLGAGRADRAKSVTGQSLKFVGLFGVLMALVGVGLSFPLPGLLGAAPEIQGDASLYFRILACAWPCGFGIQTLSAILRCAGDTKTPAGLNVLMNLLNVVLNALFIYASGTLVFFGVPLPGLGWGVAGAAVASSFSQAVIFGLYLRKIFHKESPTRVRFGERYPFERETLLTAWRLGLPVALERILTNGAQVLITGIISRVGTVAVAANHLAVTAEALSYLPAFGISTAATTLVGQAIGAGRKELATRFARLVTWLGVLIMTLGGAVLYLFAPQLITIFSQDPEVIKLGARVLRIVAFAEPLFGASIVAAGALRGAGDSKWPFLISLATMWGVRITLSIALVGSLGLEGVWLAMAAELCARGLIFLVRLYRGRWVEIRLFEKEGGG